MLNVDLQLESKSGKPMGLQLKNVKFHVSIAHLFRKKIMSSIHGKY